MTIMRIRRPASACLFNQRYLASRFSTNGTLQAEEHLFACDSDTVHLGIAHNLYGVSWTRRVCW